MLQEQQRNSGTGAKLTIGVCVISYRDVLCESGGVACRCCRTHDDGTHDYPPVGNFQTSNYVGPLDPLEKDKLIHIDRDDQRFGCGMAVRLETEDPMLHRKNDARELLKIGDVVRGPYTAADLDAVVVPLQQSFLIEVQRLLRTVGRDIRGKADLQTTPRFACFLPRLDFFGFNAGSGKEKRSIHIRPHRASSEVCELQIAPGGLESMSFER